MIGEGRVMTAVERYEGTGECDDDTISNSTRQLCKAFNNQTHTVFNPETVRAVVCTASSD